MSTKERIEEIILASGMSAGEFADAIGLGRTVLNHILKERNNPSLDVMMKIHKFYPSLPWEWLLEGKGDFDAASLAAPTSHEVSAPDGGLFRAENLKNPTVGADDDENCREMQPNTAGLAVQQTVKEVIKYVEVEPAKITEIKIFFDNGTYQTFRPHTEE